MKKEKRKLWIRALNDDGKAYRKLALHYRKKGEEELAEALLKKAVLLGDEKAFFISREKWEDAESYIEMLNDYQTTTDKRVKKQLEKYIMALSEKGG